MPIIKTRTERGRPGIEASGSLRSLLAPSISSTPRRLAGWNNGPSELRRETNFWYKVWDEAECPSSGVLFNIKKNAKSRYKYAVRRIKRRQNHLVRNKLAQSFSKKRKNNFWSVVKGLAKSHKPTCGPIVDGISGGNDIANMWASKLSNLLNTHGPTSRESLYTSLKSSLSDSQLYSIYVTEDDVLDAISQIKTHKSDSCGLSSEHLKSSASANDSLAVFFTTILRHGYMPKAFRDCVLVPIPKGSKDASCSKNYRAIALASSLSKVLERVLLLKYQSFFVAALCSLSSRVDIPLHYDKEHCFTIYTQWLCGLWLLS